MAPQTRSHTSIVEGRLVRRETTKRGVSRESVSESAFKPPPKKKARSNRNYSKEETGKLAILHFANLPIELLVEIANGLSPVDLIHLSRANKLLRRMFMCRPAAGVWRAALANVGLPPCPDDSMPEPQYAALLFFDQCSECGKLGPRRVDPILLVRLCCACRMQMAMNSDDVGELTNVINHSEYLLPPWTDSWPKGCLLREYEEMQDMFSKLKADSDFAPLCAWQNSRAELIRTREKRAEPLYKWLQHRYQEEEKPISVFERARAIEVESRLLKLGWRKDDIREGANYCDEWPTLVYKAKPLNDTDWRVMLPYLLTGLEAAQEQRFKKESRRRGWDRSFKIDSWLRSLYDQMDHLELTLRWKKLSDTLASGSNNKACTPLYSQVKKNDVTIRIPAMPRVHTISINYPPQLRTLLDQDVPTEKFLVTFQSKQGRLKEQYIRWRRNLEAALVRRLPDRKSLKPVALTHPSFSLVASTNADGSENPSGGLSLDLRKLLRADVRFTGLGFWKSIHYPDPSGSWTIDADEPAYNPEASCTAKAILCELQRPDASYLEMRALGKSFLCLRCPKEPLRRTWDEIVDHFIMSDAIWSFCGDLFEATSTMRTGIAGKPPHAVDAEHEEPLVRLVPAQDQEL